MSHTSDIDSRSNPDGLQEIRSWASRSPDAARPGFRTRPWPGGFGRSSLRIAASLGLALILLLSLAGYRSLQNGRGTSVPAADPDPEQVATSAPVPTDEAPPATEAVADSPSRPKEPVVARATLAEKPEPDERVRPKPAAKEPRSSSRSRLVVRPEAFESEPAVLLSEPTAQYPDAARGTGATAKVVVGFTIDETGAVRNPAIESSRVQGDASESLFKEAALAAARRARFHPARERGEPTASWNTLTFTFETEPASAGL